MDLITELDFIISKSKSDINLDAFLNPDTKPRILYDLIKNGKVKSDTEAAKTLYNSSKSDKKYLVLKKNLINKLSNVVYLSVDESTKRHYSNIALSLEKQLTIADKFLLNNVYHNAQKIINKVERKAEEFALIDIQITAAKKFSSLYSLKGDIKNTKASQEKIIQLSEEQNIINHTEGFWNELYAATKFHMGRPQEILTECESFIKKAKAWIKKTDSPFFNLYYVRILEEFYYLKWNLKKSYECTNALGNLLNEHFFLQTDALKADICYKRARYYKDVQAYDKAETWIKDSYRYNSYESFDRFEAQALYFDIAIKQNEFKKAHQIFNDTLQSFQYKYLNDIDKAVWLIREAILFLLFSNEKDSASIKSLPHFYQKLSSESFAVLTKAASKKKDSSNIVLLVVKLLLYKDEHHVDLENEGKSLKIYHHRYLKNLNSPKTEVFFKLFAKAATKTFDKKEITKIYKEYSSLTQGIKHHDDYEIIPYQAVWKMIGVDIK